MNKTTIDAANVLEISNLRVEFPSDDSSHPVIAVKGIELELKRGQILGIVGESGSGKSVTSLAIMGLIAQPGKIKGEKIAFLPTKNHAELQETINLLSLREDERRKYRGGEIAMIFQEPMSSLNPVYNIGFQLIEAIQLHQEVSLTDARRKACELLQKVKLIESDQELQTQYINEWKNKKFIPTQSQIDKYINQQKRDLLARFPHQLSGGQLQRVMIAMAISCKPTILIADEPTTALDVTIQAEIITLLKELCRQENMSMIFITHDLSVIANIANYIAVMYKGYRVEYGTREEILFNPKHPYTKALLNCRPRLDRQLEKLPTVADYIQNESEDTQNNKIYVEEKEPPQFEIISSQAEATRLTELKKKEPLLKVQDLSVCFSQRGLLGQNKKPFVAVNNISFEVFPGETLGLVGESGCGKSTLARTLLRLIPASGGKIFYRRDEDRKIDHPLNEITYLEGKSLQKLRRNMQIIFQNPYSSLNPRLSIGKAIMEPIIIHNTGENERQRKERVSYLLTKVGFDFTDKNKKWLDLYPHELSGGQRQRVCIARALTLNPKFIICDESVSSLDVSVQAQVLNLLKDLQKEFNLTYIFISHDLSVVRFMSDRIIVMNKGEEVELDTAENIINHPTQPYTRNLINSIPKFPDEMFNLKLQKEENN